LVKQGAEEDDAKRRDDRDPKCRVDSTMRNERGANPIDLSNVSRTAKRIR
jgi:hypothetical protein